METLGTFRTRYLGVFLTRDSRRLLLERCPPRHSKVYAEHMTILHAPFADEPPSENRVRVLDLKVIGEYADSRGQCVIVDSGLLPDQFQELLKANGRVPHITVSTDKYTEPVYSNYLMGTSLMGPLTSSFVVTGYVAWCKSATMHDPPLPEPGTPMSPLWNEDKPGAFERMTK